MEGSIGRDGQAYRQAMLELPIVPVFISDFITKTAIEIWRKDPSGTHQSAQESFSARTLYLDTSGHGYPSIRVDCERSADMHTNGSPPRKRSRQTDDSAADNAPRSPGNHVVPLPIPDSLVGQAF